MPSPDLTYETSYLDNKLIVAGIDEAGRGPWAGPVVAAAVILDIANIPPGINDSKAISSKKREIISALLHQSAYIGIGIATVEEIDATNILAATKLAMQRAVTELPFVPDIALIDGNQLPTLSCKMQAIVKGDSKSLSIAAASIVAKVKRDAIMTELATLYPYYGWERNAGYGTKLHQEGLATGGISPFHRKTFAPIRRLIDK